MVAMIIPLSPLLSFGVHTKPLQIQQRLHKGCSICLRHVVVVLPKGRRVPVQRPAAVTDSSSFCTASNSLARHNVVFKTTATTTGVFSTIATIKVHFRETAPTALILFKQKRNRFSMFLTTLPLTSMSHPLF